MLPLLLIAAAGPLAAPGALPAARPCEDAKLQQAGATPRPGIHPLTQEPPAKQILAVLRTENGCSRPVVVRERIGAPPRR